jgi:hypothetical protein
LRPAPSCLRAARYARWHGIPASMQVWEGSPQVWEGSPQVWEGSPCFRISLAIPSQRCSCHSGLSSLPLSGRREEEEERSLIVDLKRHTQLAVRLVEKPVSRKQRLLQLPLVVSSRLLGRPEPYCRNLVEIRGGSVWGIWGIGGVGTCRSRDLELGCRVYATGKSKKISRDDPSLQRGRGLHLQRPRLLACRTGGPIRRSRRALGRDQARLYHAHASICQAVSAARREPGPFYERMRHARDMSPVLGRPPPLPCRNLALNLNTAQGSQ